MGKVLITESTKEVVEDELEKKLDEMDEQELMKKINESKVAVAKRDKDGNIEVKQSLNG
jgi:uncharacterized membrane protein